MMDYYNYYPAQTGQPPPLPPTTMMGNNNHQHDCTMMPGQMTPTGLMHSSPAPSTPQSMRHTPGPPPMQQHHMSPHHPMTPQQQPSPHSNYHQLPQHPPISLSASPHPSSTPHSQAQPPPRPSTGPSPLHHHHHSPIHMNGPSPKNPTHGHMPMQSRRPSNQLPQHGHSFSSNSMPPNSGNANSHYGQPSPAPQMNHHQQHLQPPPLPQQSMNHNGPPHMMQSAPVMTNSGAPTPSSPHPPSGYMPSHIGAQQSSQERGSPFHQHIPQSEFRIIELNKRLQSRPRVKGSSSPLPLIGSSDESNWWERFASDFFDDESSLSIRIPGEEKLIEYTIGRALIPRFFKSYFDGGVTDLSIRLTNIRETHHHSSLVTLDCDQADIVTKNIFKHPATNMLMYVVVHTEGQLSLEFVGNSFDNLVIRSWRFYANQCHEYIDRSLTVMGLPSTMLIEPTTVQGLPKSTISYLKICSILEPMQDIMAHHKLSNMDPKSCLKKFLYDKHRFISEDDTNKVVPVKRRKRKQDTVPVPKSSTTTPKKSKTATPAISTNNASTQSNLTKPDLPPISIVGEPLRMEEYRDENERLITKMENLDHQCDPKIKMDTSKSDELDFVINSIGEKDKQVEKSDSSVTCSLEDSETLAVVKTVPEIEKSTYDCKLDIVKQTNSAKEVLESSNEESSSRPVSEEPSEKENNGSVLNEETSVATQSENHFNIMNRIPEDGEDVCKTSDLVVTKLPQSVNNSKISVQSNSKQSRRRSNEKREKFCDGLMRTSDFVVAIKDLKFEHPPLWRITTGNNLLQQFEPKTINGVILYENTNQYAGWNPEIKRDYVGVDVKVLSHNRNQILAERLQLNFQNLDDSENFHDKHFLIYLQILISTALDPKFWESIETEPKHHDYFLTSRKIMDEIIKRHKSKLSSKLKLGEALMKNFEKYPNLIIKPIDETKQAQTCRACNTHPSTQMVSFGNRSYDLHSYKPVKVTSEPSKKDEKDDQSIICDTCLNIVKLYSEVHHMGWKFFNSTLEKVDQLRSNGKPVNAILDECLNDEEWINKNYAERDTLWSRINEVH